MENITAIYLNPEKTWFETKPYNGSWHPIVMDTTDGLDYSIPVYEEWYSFIDDFCYDEETMTEIELTDEQCNLAFEEFRIRMEDFGWEFKTYDDYVNSVIDKLFKD